MKDTCLAEGHTVERLIASDEARIRRDIEALAEIVDPASSGFTRISFTREDRMARDYVRESMSTEAGLDVRIDEAGNLIGQRAGKSALPCIMVGSHLDTVPGGGRFDGIAGVIAGLEIARRLKEENITLNHPLEVVVFLAEEPSPFGISTIGSRAMAGKLPSKTLATLKDATGRTLHDGIIEMGGDPGRIESAQRDGKDIRINLELHIEQGPLLYDRGIDIGIVTGIAGIYRGRIQILGRMDHAGTTPMDIRKDALCAASEIALALERICRGNKGVVGTAGTLKIDPGAANVVPGKAVLGLEIRCLEQRRLEKVVNGFSEAVEQIRFRRGVDVKADIWPSSNPVHFNADTIQTLVSACRRLKVSYLELPSGAGHDASHMAEIAPAGMLFIPCRDGRSHCPEEWSEIKHIGIGTNVLARTILSIDEEK